MYLGVVEDITLEIRLFRKFTYEKLNKIIETHEKLGIILLFNLCVLLRCHFYGLIDHFTIVLYDSSYVNLRKSPKLDSHYKKKTLHPKEQEREDVKKNGRNGAKNNRKWT